MKLTDLHEYGLSGPYAKASSSPEPTTSAKPQTGSFSQTLGLPGMVKNVKAIKTVKDIPKPDKKDPKKPFGVYDQKKKLIAIAMRKNPNMPPILIDPKSKKPMQNLRGLFIQDPQDQTDQESIEKTESVLDKFLKLSLAEQLRIVENIDVNKLDRILNERK